MTKVTYLLMYQSLPDTDKPWVITQVQYRGGQMKERVTMLRFSEEILARAVLAELDKIKEV